MTNRHLAEPIDPYYTNTFRVYKLDENGFSKDEDRVEACCDFCSAPYAANTRVVAYRSDPTDLGICETCWNSIGRMFAQED